MKKLPKFVITFALVAVGCKQGLGERCQINDDCTSPYVCNQAKKECQETTTGGIDATLLDAPFIVIDGAVDAGVDSNLADAPID